MRVPQTQIKLMQRISLLILGIVLTSSCEENYSPKPTGYHRIVLAEKEYQKYSGDCPFSFDYPVQSIIDDRKQNCWINLHYPQFNSTIHMSYVGINENELGTHIEDSRNLAMKHLVKADDLKEKQFRNDEKRVYGLSFDFEGNTASNYQFFLTDSNRHFFRGAMYFNIPPNSDSLAPVIDYIKEDLEYLIESFRWAQSDES